MKPFTEEILLESKLPGVALLARGKVRDIYHAGADRLLIVATDRISAFDCVLPTGIPRKGEVLTRLSLFWFELLRPLTPTHFVTAEVREYPAPLQAFAGELAGRSMVVEKAEMAPVECVARGYLAGSGWKEYQRDGTVCGIALPAGLQESDRLPEPIFTPATKAQSGHDENIPFHRMEQMVGSDLSRRLRELTLEIYARAAALALERGIIIADTKLEFGHAGGRLVLADEVLTPDSSRFWPLEGYRPGGPQDSYDKQYVRDYLESAGWSKQPPAPPLPESVAQQTSRKYQQALLALTGKGL